MTFRAVDIKLPNDRFLYKARAGEPYRQVRHNSSSWIKLDPTGAEAELATAIATLATACRCTTRPVSSSTFPLRGSTLKQRTSGLELPSHFASKTAPAPTTLMRISGRKSDVFFLSVFDPRVSDLRDKGEIGAEPHERAKPGCDESLAGGRPEGLSAIWSRVPVERA